MPKWHQEEQMACLAAPSRAHAWPPAPECTKQHHSLAGLTSASLCLGWFYVSHGVLCDQAIHEQRLTYQLKC